MDLEVVVEEMMTMIPTQGMMTMAGILIEELLVILEGALEEVIHLEEVFPFQEETHHQETISVMDLIPGDTQDFHLLVFQEGMEIPQGPQGIQGQVGIQEEEEDFLFIFLILMLDQIHHHFSSCLT